MYDVKEYMYKMSCVSVQVQVERVFTDFYFTLRAWVTALKYTLPTHPHLENQLNQYPILLSYVLSRLINTEVDRLVLEGLFQQFIETIIRIARNIQTQSAIESMYLHLKDLATQIAIFIHERYPRVRRNTLIDLFHSFVHAIRTEMCFTLGGSAHPYDAAYCTLGSLRKLLDYLLYYLR